MKMSDGEKLIAYMLADIMEGLKLKGDIDPDFIKSAVSGDDLWALEWKYRELFHNEGPSQEVADETAAIMTMCSVMENSIAQLTPEERATIPEHQQQVFVGFDGNHEPHHGVAKMLVHKLDRFSEWEGRALNSHHHTLTSYRRMNDAFDRIDWSHQGVLDLAGIRTVLGL